ncbi:MAG: hypothetical protein GEV08_02215 [Acidimicrobiia bacterium]|nr:hypothetical protein [Acidimicrobiia bacterium]
MPTARPVPSRQTVAPRQGRRGRRQLVLRWGPRPTGSAARGEPRHQLPVRTGPRATLTVVRADLPRAIAEGLREAGAEVAFGFPGGGPNLDVVGAVTNAGLRFVLAHGESAACTMAATYGLLTGCPALALATRGPGAASAANGAAQATLDRFPLLLVTDAVPERHAARVAHQRLDQRALLAAVTKWSGRLGHDDPSATVRAALDLAAASPRGAVHLDYDPSAAGDRPAPLAPAEATEEAEPHRQAAALLAAAHRPVVVLGLGALADAEAVRRHVTRLGCPVLSTYQATGLLDSEADLAAGLFTNGASERPLLEQADLILTIGLDPVEPIPAAWDYAVPVLSLQPCPLDEPYTGPAVCLHGPLGALLAELVELADAAPSRPEWGPRAGAEHREQVRDQLLAGRGDSFGPLQVVEVARDAAPPGVTATVDAGAHFLAVMPLWPTPEPLSLLISNGLATMAFALPAAIGAALARPGRPVVCFVGDGGLAMTLGELETLARLALPVTVVLFDDAALSLIAIKQRPGQGGEAAVRFGPIDYAAMARAAGIEGTTVDSAAELAGALAEGWGRPRLVDARIDPGAYSHLLRVTRG